MYNKTSHFIVDIGFVCCLEFDFSLFWISVEKKSTKKVFRFFFPRKDWYFQN